MKVWRESDGAVVAKKCTVANTMVSRMIGLLRHKALETDEGLWIVPCNSIHTFFMRFAIDAVFLDREQRIVRIYSNMKPWRISWTHFSAHSVLELASGVAGQMLLERGQQLKFEE